MHLLVREDKGPWTIQPNVELFQPKNKDIVTFDIKEPHDRYSIHIFVGNCGFCSNLRITNFYNFHHS